jgi:regulator of protease activity HflC (stomatin/prohibitin superfamily)
MSGHTASAEPDHADDLNGPVVQSLRITFRALQIALFLLACGWAGSNIRQVPPDTQAIVLRFGQVVRVQQAGLMLAWPRPIEQVVLLPGAQRQLSLVIDAGTARGAAIIDPASRLGGQVPLKTTGSFLTGGNGVVLLDASLNYRVTDPAAYYVAQAHVEPALRALFLAAAVTVAAQRAIDDFLVVGDARAAAQTQREAIRGALVQEVNRRLEALKANSADLGIAVTRGDVRALLPPAAKDAFDAVLDATQMAEQGLAAARTDAARIQQSGDQERDRVLTEARASADERISVARSHAASVMALADRADSTSAPSLMEQLYRERIAGIMKDAGSVTTVDPQGGNRLILPGAMQP